MKNNVIKVVVAVALVAAVALMLLARGCPRSDQRPERPAEGAREPERDPVDLVIKGSETLQEDEEGNVLWKIRASETRMNELEGRASVSDGEVAVFQEGKSQMRVVFANLTASSSARRLYAWGGITAESQIRGMEFKADKITVDLLADKVIAAGNIRGSHPTGSFKAEKLESDLRFDRVILSSPTGVEGTIRYSSGRGNR